MKKSVQILFFILFVYTVQGQAIDPADIAKNVGKTVTVYGMIYDGKYLSKLSTKPTFLDFGGRFPNQIATIVIEDSNRANFSYKPEEFLKHRTVWVTGKVSEYNGQYRISIVGSENLKIDTTVAILTDKVTQKPSPNDNKIFTNPQYAASFPGGLAGWDAHVTRSRLPEIIGSNELKPGVYPVKAQFIVQKDSIVTNVKVYMDSDDCRPCVARVLYLLQNSPKWEPASQDGYLVHSVVNQVFFTEVVRNPKPKMEPILRSALESVIRRY